MKLALAAILTLFLVGCSSPPENMLELNLKDHKELAMHLHPEVSIEIDGEKVLIPANVGVTNEGMRVIHTHDATGTLHVESPYPYQFYLSDFFTIWGKRFDDQCIFDSCVDETHDLKMYVNGEQSDLFGALPLKDHDRIEIVYKEK